MAHQLKLVEVHLSTVTSGKGMIIGQERNRNYADTIMDDFRYYEKELTPAEVSNLYNDGSING
jgi:hypothetical protein